MISPESLVKKCETCVHYTETAGGPDHGDIRCTKKESPVYNLRPHEILNPLNIWSSGIHSKEKSEIEESARLVESCYYREGRKGNAIITGASRGIGKVIAENFAAKGYALALISRHKEEVEKVIEELYQTRKGFYFSTQCDVSNPEQAKKTFEEIYRQFGSIDVLVNNAGVNSRKTLNTKSLETWFEDFEENLAGFDREIATNLRGAYICSYLAAGYMLRQKKGVIVNISSVKGIEPTTSPGYGASKSGMIKLTRDFAKALAPYGIRVNCIAPGFIDTGMTAELPEDKKQEYRKAIPQGRFGTPEEIAKIVKFLVSDDSSYITGATLDVNGGYVMN